MPVLLFRVVEWHFSICTISISEISLKKFTGEWEKYFPGVETDLSIRTPGFMK